MNRKHGNKRYWTREQVADYLMNMKGARPATIVIRTEPRMNKKSRETQEPNPFLNNVYKVSQFQVFLNFNYENSVNLQKRRENGNADFHAQTTWGEHVSPCLVRHQGALFLHCKLERKLDVSYRTVIKNQELSWDAIAEYMPPRSASRTQGTDKEILVLRPKLRNLIELRIDRMVIVVID